MRTRSVVLQGVLAVGAVLAAAAVASRPPEGAPGEVVVWDAPVNGLQWVRHEEPSGWVELYREPSEGGALWLRWSTPPRALRANELAGPLFARFAPLKASRALGVLDAAHLAEVGLKDSRRALRLGFTGSEQRFTLAAPASGWRGPYLRRPTDGEVFLLSASLLPDLEGTAWRLVDRTLHTFGAGDADTLTVTVEGATRAVRLAGPGVPPPEEAVRRWHERLTLLAPAAGDFLGRGEVPPGGEPREAFRVDYARGTTRLGHLSVGRGADGTVYARTEHTPGWVRLAPWADSLLEEARRLSLTPPRPP